MVPEGPRDLPRGSRPVQLQGHRVLPYRLLCRILLLAPRQDPHPLRSQRRRVLLRAHHDHRTRPPSVIRRATRCVTRARRRFTIMNSPKGFLQCTSVAAKGSPKGDARDLPCSVRPAALADPKGRRLVAKWVLVPKVHRLVAKWVLVPKDRVRRAVGKGSPKGAASSLHPGAWDLPWDPPCFVRPAASLADPKGRRLEAKWALGPKGRRLVAKWVLVPKDPVRRAVVKGSPKGGASSLHPGAWDLLWDPPCSVRRPASLADPKGRRLVEKWALVLVPKVPVPKGPVRRAVVKGSPKGAASSLHPGAWDLPWDPPCFVRPAASLADPKGRRLEAKWALGPKGRRLVAKWVLVLGPKVLVPKGPVRRAVSEETDYHSVGKVVLVRKGLDVSAEIAKERFRNRALVLIHISSSMTTAEMAVLRYVYGVSNYITSN